MSDRVIVRDYAASDRPAVLTLVQTTLVEFGFAGNVGGIEADLAAIDERYRAPHGGFFVAVLDGALVGTVAIRRKDATTCELKRLYVANAARGHGLGQRLYGHAESFARSAGYAKIWLDSSRRFTQARKLYQRNGFVLLEELHNDWEDNVYEKQLPSA